MVNFLSKIIYCSYFHIRSSSHFQQYHQCLPRVRMCTQFAPGGTGVTEQTRGRGWMIYDYRMDLPLCSRGPLPRTKFTLPAVREWHFSMPKIGEKERDYLFKELYKLKSNNLMSSLRSQSSLEYPQTHSPSFPLFPVWGTVSQKKK